jgi:hypothetical protein
MWLGFGSSGRPSAWLKQERERGKERKR